MLSRACVALIVTAWSLPASAAALPKLAIFPLELIEDVNQGDPFGGAGEFSAGVSYRSKPEDLQRLALATDALKKFVIEDGRYETVDLAPLAADIGKAQPIHKCNGCEDDLAKKAGAELAIIGTVKKGSSLIFQMNLFLRDVVNGKILKIMSTEVLGATDEAWLRGIKIMAKNKLLSNGESK